MKLDRRYLRYSLRTAFIVLTVGCVWLGAQVERVRKQREAVAKIRACGGGVQYDWELPWLDSHPLTATFWESEDWHPPGPAWLRRLIGDDFFQRVDRVHFLGPFDERAFAVCLEFPDLKSVHLNCVTASSGVPRPQRCPELRYPNVSDEHLKLLATSTQLEWISFSGTAITDDGLEPLKSLRRLRHLDLGDTNVSDDGLRVLKDIPSLEEVYITHAPKVTGQGMTELMKALPNCTVSR